MEREKQHLGTITVRTYLTQYRPWCSDIAAVGTKRRDGTNKRKNSRMGSILTKWWWGGDPDEENPLSGLTLRDIYAVQKTWTPLYAEPEKYGMELFIRLFRMDPSTKTFFKIIRPDADDRQYIISNHFKAHVINFMSSINMAVHSLNHPTVVMAMMEKLGQSHTRLHVDRRHFDEVKAVLVDFLKNDLKLDKSTLESWHKFVTFIYKHIFLQLKTKQFSAIF